MLERLCNNAYYEMRLVLRSIRYLKNWRELYLGYRREMSGRQTADVPVLRFRSGLEIGMVPGGYGGYYILFPEIFVKRCYQPTREFAVRDGWTVIDLGANMGFFTCKAATTSKFSQVIAVEPVSAYVEVLRDNIRRNGLTNVRVLHAAASGEAGKQISIPVWYTASGEPKTDQKVPPNTRVETETVMGLTLGEIIEKGKVKRCHLLKIDIEGAEYKLFDDVPASVWNQIERVVMETHRVEGRDESDLVKILQGQGFQTHVKGHMLWALKGNLC